jgi:hypothetical protein
MARVGERHEKVAVPDDGGFALVGAPVYGDMLPKRIAGADFEIALRFAVKPDRLRYIAEDDAAMDDIARTDGGITFYAGMRVNNGPLADFDFVFDHDVGAYYRILRDGGMGGD